VCGNAGTGVVWGAGEVDGMVCSRRLDSDRPHVGTACAHASASSVASPNQSVTVRAVCVYSLWVSISQAQVRVIFPMRTANTPKASVHGSDLYMP
jgi:hypothetical protein